MNWLPNLISKKPDTVHSGVSIDDQSFPATDLIDEPVSIESQPLSLDSLRKFIPLRNLDDKHILQIPHSVATYAAGSNVFILGHEATAVYYLLQGTVNIQPNADNSYDVVVGTTLSHLPLNSGQIFGSTAVATTEVKILRVAAELTTLWVEQNQESLSCIELRDIELPAEIGDNRFFNSFAQAYRENKLYLPSLPDVALKLQEAMRHEIGVGEAAEILQIDAPIVAKLIQLANSALYSPVTPITSCIDALNRLGLDATRNLVMGISLKQLFRCKDPKLMKRMQALWMDSLYVSSLSFVLAQESGKINPDKALFAGLISDMGIIPLLHFADQYPEEYPDFEQLEQSMPYLRAPVGSLLLHTLGFTDELVEIPNFAEDWFFESGNDLSLIDIVILAKLHAKFGRKKTTGLPYINSIPAYSKIKDGKLNPDFSLNVLYKANKRIKSAMRVLA